MILVDNQSGSNALFPYISALTPDSLLTRIDPPYGDIAWLGNGPDDAPLRVGVEYKTIDDILDCIMTGRFSGHQLIGMTQNYDRRYLLVEGRIRSDRNTGRIQKLYGSEWYDITKGSRTFQYGDLEHWYTTLEEQAQYKVVKSYDKYESARWVLTKYDWWQKKWDEHAALQQFYVPPPPNAVFTEPTLTRRVAKELYKIGWVKSIAVESKFNSVREMINADEKAWATIEGIGKGIAHKIVAEINKER